MASWGCPHEINGACQKVKQLPCDPGMRGCVLYGRFVFSNPAKNRPAKPDSRGIGRVCDGEPPAVAHRAQPNSETEDGPEAGCGGRGEK